MKNKEKFAKEIIEIAATGTSIAMCNGVLRECRGLYCSQCDFCSDRECDEKIKEWAESNMSNMRQIGQRCRLIHRAFERQC